MIFRAFPRGCALLALPLLLCCARERRTSQATLPLDVEVRSETPGGSLLPVRAPAESSQARVWVASVAPVRSSPADLEPPEAPQDSLAPGTPDPPMLEIDDDLKAPILKQHAVLSLPPGTSSGPAVRSVELDVRVDEGGAVTDALWAGGSNDPRLVQAATECALEMRFFPALQRGQPIPVWCRQRFDFPARR